MEHMPWKKFSFRVMNSWHWWRTKFVTHLFLATTICFLFLIMLSSQWRYGLHSWIMQKSNNLLIEAESCNSWHVFIKISCHRFTVEYSCAQTFFFLLNLCSNLVYKYLKISDFVYFHDEVVSSHLTLPKDQTKLMIWSVNQYRRSLIWHIQVWSPPWSIW